MDFQSSFMEERERLWIPRGGISRTLSYPDEGNDLCYAIEESSFWFQHRNNVIATLVKKYPPKGSFLDVGGGNGYVSLHLMREGIDAIVVEPGRQGALNAHRRGLQVVNASLDKESFSDESIAAFGLFDVLEHIEQDQEFLNLLTSKLMPQGYLFLTVPAFQWLWSFEDVFAGHFRRYTASSLSEKIMQAGLQVKYSTYFFSFLPPAIFFMRVIPTLLGTRKAVDVKIVSKEHSLPSDGMTKSVLDRLLKHEVQRVERGKQILWGSSVLLVAQKVGSEG